MNDSPDRTRFIRGFLNVALVTFLSIGAYALYTRQEIHLAGALPWLLLLLCPLAHRFLHGGHGHHRTRAAPLSVGSKARAAPASLRHSSPDLVRPTT
jgi:hypothetical protein